MNGNERADANSLVVQAPAYSKTSREIYTILKQAVEDAESGDPEAGRELMLKRLAELIGVPQSTMHDWLHGHRAESVKRFLCALERLSSASRAGVLDLLCRDCPRLDHPALVLNSEARASLSALLEQRHGLTFVSGPFEWARTFMLTALGNSAAGRLSASGFDVHRPDRFVPIPGVWHLARPIAPQVLASLLDRLWPAVARSEAPLLFFNGVWSALPELRRRILACAEAHHVFVADHGGESGAKHRFPVSEVLVAPSSRDPSSIEAAIRTL